MKGNKKADMPAVKQSISTLKKLLSTISVHIIPKTMKIVNREDDGINGRKQKVLLAEAKRNLF